MLKIENLCVEFPNNVVLDDVSLTCEKGQILGIVGESGSGKTMTVLAAMGLLPEGGKITGGSIYFDGKRLDTMNDRELSDVRGNDIAMIFQEPMTSLNPTMKIGAQLMEALILHHEQKDKQRVLNALTEAHLPNPEEIYDKYPHELSGGMRQRAMIAMGVICRPDFLVCDEPTTALDVTTEKEIIKLIERLRKEHNMGIIFITHDLKLLRSFADEVAVMYKGHVVERGTPEQIFSHPNEEYTKKLISSIPDRKHRKRDTV